MTADPAPELLTPAEMARADALAAEADIPTLRLMEAAGRAVALAARRRFRPGRVLVLAGPGNNGGDGYVAARLLEAAGWPVSVAPLAAPRPGSDAAAVAERWRGPLVPFSVAEAGRASLVIDAVFGAGLARPVEGPVAEVLQACRAPLLAIDTPSGLDGATGQVQGFAPQAALTVTFFRLKPGHLLLPGRSLCGETLLAEIGLPASVLARIAPRNRRNGPGLWRLPAPGPDSHKYTRGHLTILGGAAMTGAARLAAGAAHRTGAGLVTLRAPDAASAALYRAAEPGSLVTEAPIDALLADPRRVTWLIGPGLEPNAATRTALRQVIAAGRQLVADAGALGAAAGSPGLLQGAAILTPHAGEFARLFGPIGPDKPESARRAAARTGAVVLLKGADTVIAAPDGRTILNHNAPPSLATGGTGDVLAGTIAALLAQGMPAFEAAAAGAWLQGEAARRHGPGLLAEDLITLLPAAAAEACKP